MTRRIDEIAGHRFETGFTDDGDDNLTDLRYPPTYVHAFGFN